jgi:dolichol kinase
MDGNQAERSNQPLSIISEIKRKSIHLSMIAIPIWMYLAPAHLATLGLIIATITTIVLDVARLSDNRLKSFFLHFFRSLMRPHEVEHLMASTYFMIAALISVLVFDKTIAISALSFLVLGDAVAAIIGKKYGRIKYWGKSVEGSAACFACCFIVGVALMGVQRDALTVIISGSLAATLAEALPAPMDDNMRVPLISGFVMQIVSFLV